MPQVPSEILTLKDLSAYLKIAPSSLYKLVRQGGIPGRKVGKRWRFHRQAIDKWLQGSQAKGQKRSKR
ncbi:MAG: helix-turn-helix domain-containing protein [Spirochaetia bacterium]|jgi:excisionase family DNA binding protein